MGRLWLWLNRLLGGNRIRDQRIVYEEPRMGTESLPEYFARNEANLKQMQDSLATFNDPPKDESDFDKMFPLK